MDKGTEVKERECNDHLVWQKGTTKSSDDN